MVLNTAEGEGSTGAEILFPVTKKVSPRFADREETDRRTVGEGAMPRMTAERQRGQEFRSAEETPMLGLTGLFRLLKRNAPPTTST